MVGALRGGGEISGGDFPYPADRGIVLGREDMECEVCGGNLWPDDYLKAYLCGGHLKQVKECINILKGERKVQVERVHSGYRLDAGVFTVIGGSSRSEGSLTKDAADALYGFMRRERGED